MNLLRGVNPVTRVAAMMVATTPLLLSLDWLSALVAIIGTFLLAPLCGVGWGALLRRSLPLLLIAPITGISMLLYARPGGREYFSFLAIHITDNSLTLSLAIVLRVLALGLPVMVLSARVDPTDLGDGLAQVARLPARFVIASVAATRLLTLVRDDAASLRRARRARGVADRGRIRGAFTLLFGLLVSSLRRGTKLSVAMEARGFGRAGVERTWARPSTVGRRDAAALLAWALLPAVALGCAWLAGTFRLLGVA
ncbi:MULTISPECIES: energy-coupling factor transporter transmembrane component T [unclassified Corynebacterium]|uniref:energy-coupling factor transporter transmembrane component T family protein n=1 Tax=unclassified Corynebacterium TaxID=2624378 RepID=UPI0029C9B74D|nr:MULTISPECIES: energy-coupling factor transporter transmembrane component T [unclassified Corynebacterium]WPF66937.1 energy-coupling factor transporter transmembrane component T [Corynebacterium sp. 22KM0430]WPF69425.1 energy-coupling factor transporter transmembrane component T [Corynebacterium sp. 21KM1197]